MAKAEQKRRTTSNMATQLTDGLAILFVILASVLAMATAAVVTVTVLCVLRCRRSGTVGARLLAVAWSLVLVGAVGYASVRMNDMTLDPAKSDFWWSAWMTIVGLGNALVAVAGAVLGGASPQDPADAE